MEFNYPKGIYLQIADQIREQVLGGEWSPGDRIFSVREMAASIGVNPNTVARSYQALVEQNIIVNIRGKGYFVSEDAVTNIKEDMREEFFQELLPRLIKTIRLLDIEPEEIAARITIDDQLGKGGN